MELTKHEIKLIEKSRELSDEGRTSLTQYFIPIISQGDRYYTNTGTSDDKILKEIIELFLPSESGFDCDPTYSKGVFYKSGTIKEPAHKFDIEPQHEDVIKADCTQIPLSDGSLKSIIFDPPFLGGSLKKKIGINKIRFGVYKNIPLLWEMYENAIKEFKRLLIDNGVLVFKCQDSVESGKNYFSSVKIINMALYEGFDLIEKYFLLKHRLQHVDKSRQQHARKMQCYYLVFKNRKSKIKYLK